MATVIATSAADFIRVRLSMFLSPGSLLQTCRFPDPSKIAWARAEIHDPAGQKVKAVS
jgi:hypothetical protein